jgi:hypothetical protein
MKVLYSQAVASPYHCGVVLYQVTAKASAPQVSWCVLCVWLQKGIREHTPWPKAIDLYALSRGSFRKKARNLIETAQRKSQLIARSDAPSMLGNVEPTADASMSPTAEIT